MKDWFVAVRRLRLVALVGLGEILVQPGLTLAEPMLELVEDRGSYLIMNDAQQLFETTPVNDWQGYQPLLRAIETGYRSVHRDNSTILIVLFAPPFDMGGGYHRPLANSIHGIGHAHWGTTAVSQGINGPGYYDNDGIWDGTTKSSLQGIAYLGSWTLFIDNAGIDGFSTEQLKSFLSHEVGHAWLAFPWYRGDDGTVRRNLLDWEETHWSVYVDTGDPSFGGDGPRSLLGGHDWRQLGTGVYSTETRLHELDGFNDLDLYLMGVLPAEQVDPFLVIENPTNCIWQGVPIECEDPRNANLGPPFANPDQPPIYVVEGEGRTVSIDDIISIEGPRIPAFGKAPTELPVTFVVIKRPETTVSEEDKVAIEGLVQRSIQIWNEMTWGLFPMVNRSSIADPTPGTGAFTCVEDRNSMCLAGGRFQVRVQWRRFDGVSGLGTQLDFGSDDSGLFWFFGQDNWELLIKVLDGCSVNERFWVFSAATTNVEYTLTVTDATTGESKRYLNPLGLSASAVTDTNAFFCP